MTAPDLSPEAVERVAVWLEHDPRRLTESNIAALLRALSAENQRLREPGVGWLDRHLSDPNNRAAFHAAYRRIAVEERIAQAAHPEDVCHECGGDNICWHAENDLWNRVMGSPNGIVCPICFVKRAEAAGEGGIWRMEAK